MKRYNLINIKQFKDNTDIYTNVELEKVPNFMTFFYGSNLTLAQFNAKYHMDYFFILEDSSTIYESFITKFIEYFKAKYKYEFYINEEKFKDKFNLIMLKWYDLYFYKYVSLSNNVEKILEGAKDLYTSSINRGVDNKAYQNDTPQNQFNNDFLDEDFINQYQKSLTNENASNSSSSERIENIVDRINEAMGSVRNLFDEFTNRFDIMFIDVDENMIIEDNV